MPDLTHMTRIVAAGVVIVTTLFFLAGEYG